MTLEVVGTWLGHIIMIKNQDVNNMENTNISETKTVEMILTPNEIRKQYPQGTIFIENGITYKSTGNVLSPKPSTYMASFPRLEVLVVESL